MPELTHGPYSVHYDLHGSTSGAAFVLVNGLTQYASLWTPYRDALAACGLRVLTFDLLGQGDSDKPSLFITQDDQVAMLRKLVEVLGDAPIFLAGISFGGVIALRYAIEHGHTLSGLVAMSTFAELSPQLALLGAALRQGLILGGIGYLQDLLLPMNVSNEWLAGRMGALDAVKRPGWLTNDLYALQNLMESFIDFAPLTPELGRIRVPTLILNGEHDFLTPRALHEPLRTGIPNSALVILQNAYHAFTLEYPALTASLLAGFAEDVLGRRFVGAGTVWVAPLQADQKPTPFPRGFDHLRAIPIAGGRT